MKKRGLKKKIKNHTLIYKIWLRSKRLRSIYLRKIKRKIQIDHQLISRNKVLDSKQTTQGYINRMGILSRMVKWIKMR